MTPGQLLTDRAFAHAIVLAQTSRRRALSRLRQRAWRTQTLLLIDTRRAAA